MTNTLVKALALGTLIGVSAASQAQIKAFGYGLRGPSFEFGGSYISSNLYKNWTVHLGIQTALYSSRGNPDTPFRFGAFYDMGINSSRDDSSLYGAFGGMQLSLKNKIDVTVGGALGVFQGSPGVGSPTPSRSGAVAGFYGELGYDHFFARAMLLTGNPGRINSLVIGYRSMKF